jgi:hypothetical protein
VTEDDREFEQSLRRGFDVLRGRRGECPPAELLAQFAADELPADQQHRVQEHIEVCGKCDAALLRFQDFEASPALSSDSGPDWQARERRIHAAIFPSSLRKKILVYGGPGYALAAVLAILLISEKQERPENTTKAATWRSITVLDLNVARSRADRVIAGRNPVVLSFFVAIRPDRAYSLSLDGTDPVPIESHDGKGNFQVLYDPPVMKAGTHHLLVRETEPSTGHVSQVFDFSFEIE